MNRGKYTKTLAKIWVEGIIRIGDIRGNVLPKFIELCMETPCWSTSGWAPTWRTRSEEHTSELQSPIHISYANYSFHANLGEGLRIFTSFHFPDSGLYLSNGFDFYFDRFWMAWHWKPAIPFRFFLFPVDCNLEANMKVELNLLLFVAIKPFSKQFSRNWALATVTNPYA